MKSIIKELYGRGLYPEDTKEIKEIESYISRHTNTLRDKLDGDGKDVLEKLVDNFYEYCSLSSYETFRFAIKLGASLILELTEEGDTDEQI